MTPERHRAPDCAGIFDYTQVNAPPPPKDTYHAPSKSPGGREYGRDPTDEQRAWLVSKARMDLAMRGIKLNAQVQITYLRNMHEKSPVGLACRIGDHTSGLCRGYSDRQVDGGGGRLETTRTLPVDPRG